MTWRVGSSVLSLVAAGAIGLTIAGDPPPPTGDIHLAPGTGESGQLAFTSVFRESTGGYAPQLVLLEASATGTGITASASAYSPQAGDIEWYWTFSKDGDAAWADELYSAPVNLIDEFRRKGGPVYGQRLPMVFDEPGTYYATCTAVMPDGTRATSAVRTLTVLDPDVEFTAAETYLVSTSSTWDGPTHSVGNRYTSISAAIGAARTSGATKVRILARRGETFAGAGMNTSSTLQWTFGAYSTGADPVLTSSSRMTNFGAATGRNIRVTNLDYLGGLDPQTGAGYPAFEPFFLSPEPNFNFIVSNCRFRGISSVCTLINATGFGEANAPPSGGFVAFSNNIVENRTDAVFFIQDGGDVWNYLGCAHIGNRMISAPGGLHMMASDQGGGFLNRTSLATWTEHSRQNDMYNALGNFFSGAGSLPFTQPVHRLVTGYGPGTEGVHVVVGMNQVEAGSFEMNVSSYGSGDSRYNKRNANFVFHRNIFNQGSDKYQAFITGTVTGVWVRLNIGCYSPTRTSTQFDFPDAYRSTQLVYLDQGGGYETGANTNPVKVYSNTIINFRDVGANTGVLEFGGGLSPSLVVNQNNLLHGPFQGSPVNNGPFLDEVTATPRHQGFRNYVNTTMEPRTIPATHYVDLTGVTGTYDEGTTSNIVTLTAPGTVTASVGQVINTGGSTRRLYLYNVTGTIAGGATVSVSGGDGGGSGTAGAAMVATNFLRLWQTTSAPGADAGEPFARVGFFGGLQTTAFRGALPQAV